MAEVVPQQLAPHRLTLRDLIRQEAGSTAILFTTLRGGSAEATNSTRNDGCKSVAGCQDTKAVWEWALLLLLVLM